MTGYQWLVLIGIAVVLLFTWLLLIDAVARGRFEGKTLQLDAAYRRFSSSDGVPDRSRRLRVKLLALGVLVILNVVVLGFLLSRGPGERAAESTSTQSATPSGLSSSAGPSPASGPRNGSEEETIQLEDVADSARPFEAVRIQGTYRSGADTFLRVQRWEGGRWLDFPLPTKTDQSGQFTTHVEFGQPGRYRLRVVDPDSGVTSTPFVLVIEA
ncbi:MAG TPA: hypothetical protein VF086_19680 [Propionibacteriaceae bacterium]